MRRGWQEATKKRKGAKKRASDSKQEEQARREREAEQRREAERAREAAQEAAAKQKAEEEAHARAEEERQAREQAESRASKAEKIVADVEAKYSELEERVLFLTSATSLDYDTVVNLHHQIIIYASEINALAGNFLADAKGAESVSVDEALTAFEQTILLNQKVLAVARFATRATFKLDSGQIEEDVASFVEQYINEIGQEK